MILPRLRIAEKVIESPFSNSLLLKCQEGGGRNSVKRVRKWRKDDEMCFGREKFTTLPAAPLRRAKMCCCIVMLRRAAQFLRKNMRFNDKKTRSGDRDCVAGFAAITAGASTEKRKAVAQRHVPKEKYLNP
jgi:hypothetical protein